MDLKKLCSLKELARKEWNDNSSLYEYTRYYDINTRSFKQGKIMDFTELKKRGLL